MAESMVRRLLEAERDSLAAYALRSSDAERRHAIENDGRAFEYRTEFQRDRDRIVYSRAFRRLRQKAVTGILPTYEDHRRNRLTHTLEVSQLARTIARALRLNEDLVEAIALGHDLGQPPFGPAGAKALDDLLAGRLDGRGGPGLGDLGGFDARRQGLRVVDWIEKRYAHPGLNLTDPVREGILKAGALDTTAAEGDGLRPGAAASLEAQVVGLADRIGGVLHDLDDALQAGAVDLPAVERLRIVSELRKKLGARYPAKGSRFMRANAIHRGLTHLLVTGAILASDAELRRFAARHKLKDERSFRAVRGAIAGGEVAFPRRLAELLSDLAGFLEGRVHKSRAADQVEARGRRIVLGLFAAYLADPLLLDDPALLRYKESAQVPYLRDLARGEAVRSASSDYRRDPRFLVVLADHVAGMTDGYAVEEHGRLHTMGAIPIPSVEQLRREERT